MIGSQATTDKKSFGTGWTSILSEVEKGANLLWSLSTHLFTAVVQMQFFHIVSYSHLLFSSGNAIKQPFQTKYFQEA